MLLCCLQPKELSVEEHEGVEKHKGGVNTQLFALPEMLLLHTGENCVCNTQREKQVTSAVAL